jgi:uncharacterized membrane protein YdjX (TVP38/TMEM64 family)
MVGEDSLEKVDEFAQDYGLMTLFILRFLAGGFHDFVSYAMGLTPIAFRAYILISTIGFIPGTLLWFYLARNIENPLVFVASTWVIIGLLTGGYLIWKSIGIKIIHFPKLIANLLHLLRK